MLSMRQLLAELQYSILNDERKGGNTQLWVMKNGLPYLMIKRLELLHKCCKERDDKCEIWHIMLRIEYQLQNQNDELDELDELIEK
jgi:hypothetical protein